MTAWSIHDPTEESGIERGGGGGVDANKRGSQMSLIAESDYFDASSDFSTSSGFDPGFDISSLDPLSEAASCKWRPISPERRSRRKAASIPLRPTTPTTTKTAPIAASAAAAAASTPMPPSTSMDHVYCFVGSMTLLA